MKKMFPSLSLFLCLLLLTSCGGNADPQSEQAEQSEALSLQTPSEETDSADTSQTLYDASCQSINALGYDLFAQLSDGSNICISPYSIETALGMAANGATDNTLEEIQKVMHIKDITTFNQDISASAQKLEQDAMDIQIANSIWYEADMDFSPSFEASYLPLLTDSYRADCFQRNLSDPSTIEEINSWISNATNDKITEIVSELPVDACLALFNAVYFNAEWEVPFPTEGTYEEEFYGAAKTNTVPFMHMSDKYFKYCEYQGICAIRMNYKDSDMAMDILIPSRKEEDVTELFNSLTFEEKQELYQNLSDSEEILITSLKLPCFEFASDTIRLNSYLENLGMINAFDGSAQFDTVSEGAYISDIYHKTYIRVDENGTEAAAVTAAIENTSFIPPDETVSFEADIPFLYYISDTSDGTILFLGSMSNL